MSPEVSAVRYFEGLRARGMFDREVQDPDERVVTEPQTRRPRRKSPEMSEAIHWVLSQTPRRGLLREATERFDVSYHALQKRLAQIARSN